MQRPNKRPYDSEETHDTALVPCSTFSPSIARAEALSEAALTKRQKTDENPRGTGHTFDRSIACDNARVQYGDTYNVTYHRAAEPESKEDGWPQAMAVLRFPQMNVRRQTVRDAHTGTCEWILEAPGYKSWCDTKQIPFHHGFLWIKSKPGAGKSTLMEFLLESMDQQLTPDEAVISFFFNARGDLLEHSLEGMYRQLLHQLLTRVERLQSIIPASEVSALPALDWPLPLLENLFKKCVLSLGQERVTCFIDALDECPENDIRELIDFLETLGNITATNGICFRACFSSRQYPNVTLEKCQHLILDRQSGHEQDIAAYVKNKLRLSKSKMNDEIKADIQKRAQGVFLWVVLVVKRLNQDLDRGNVHRLQSRLKELPDGLEALFRVRLTGIDDEMLMMMQWMMYARGTLTQKELYFAVHTGRLADPEPWDRDGITSEVMDRFIVNCSRGLIESTKQLYPRTQFIHESVRDYLSGGGLELLAPEHSKNMTGASHDHLKRSCLKLLTSSTFNNIPSLDRMLESEDEQAYVRAGRDLIMQFPLLGYAFTHILHHADITSQHGVDQLEFVTSFPFRIWNQMRVLMGRSPARSKTEVFAQHGCLELLEYETRPGCSLLAPAEHVLAIRMAIRDRSYWVLDLVLKRGDVHKVCADEQVSFVRSAIHWHDRYMLEIMFHRGIRLRTAPSFLQLLSQALRFRNAAVVRALLDHEAHVGPFTTDALPALLDGDADLNALPALNETGNPAKPDPSQGEIVAHDLTAFQYAALSGQEKYVRLFLDYRPANQRPPHRLDPASPMYLAALLGHHTIVAQILKDPSRLTSPNNAIWRDALCAAVLNGHLETVKALLAEGPSVQAREFTPAFCERVIRDTISGRHEETLRTLLDFLDTLPQFRAQRRKTLSDALTTAAERRDAAGCLKVLREKGARLAEELEDRVPGEDV